MYRRLLTLVNFYQIRIEFVKSKDERRGIKWRKRREKGEKEGEERETGRAMYLLKLQLGRSKRATLLPREAHREFWKR